MLHDDFWSSLFIKYFSKGSMNARTSPLRTPGKSENNPDKKEHAKNYNNVLRVGLLTF